MKEGYKYDEYNRKYTGQGGGNDVYKIFFYEPSRSFYCWIPVEGAGWVKQFIIFEERHGGSTMPPSKPLSDEELG